MKRWMNFNKAMTVMTLAARNTVINWQNNFSLYYLLALGHMAISYVASSMAVKKAFTSLLLHEYCDIGLPC